MNSSRFSRIPHVLAAFVVSMATSAAVFIYFHGLSEPRMTTLSDRLQPLFSKKKTVCFGRFIIEVPQSAEVIWGRMESPGKVFRYPGERSKLAQRVAERVHELKSQERYPTGSGQSLFKEAIDGTVPNHKIVMGWQSFSNSIYKVDSYIPLGEDLYVQQDTALPGDSASAREEEITVPQVVDTLNAVARDLRQLAEDEVPGQPGICIDGAFLPDRLDQRIENIGIGFRLKEFPDVHFSVETMRIEYPQSEGQDLLSRQLRAEKDAHKFGKGLFYERIAFLRKEKRAVAGFDGFEILGHKPADGDKADSHQFTFEYAGEPKNSLVPSMSVQMDTGMKGDRLSVQSPSLTDEEALALWDKLTGSIRLRPTSADAQAAVAAKIALGERATTGRKCPQTGWWECVDELPFAESRGQFICAGDPMPGIQVWSEPTIWSRLRGERQQRRAATEWRLTSYDGPRREPISETDDVPTIIDGDAQPPTGGSAA